LKICEEEDSIPSEEKVDDNNESEFFVDSDPSSLSESIKKEKSP
jgi:hypothetical protein